MNSWIVENLGWTLLHSLWQIGFVALVLFPVRRILRDFSANLRYAVSVAALCLSLILPVATFVYYSTETSPVQTIKQTSPDIFKPVSAQPIQSQMTVENVDVPPTISPDKSAPSPSPNIPFLPITVTFWLIGVAFFSLRLIGGVWTIHLYKTRKISAVDSEWQTKFDELCKTLQMSGKIRFLQSQIVQIPMVIGWLKPVVLFPAGAFLQISPKELEAVLLHELAHVKRHDYLINFGQSVVEILFFYHPCVWWISAKIRTEREFAVDEFVSQIFENDRVIYAKALASFEEIRAVSTINLAMAANGGNLMKRIENILNGSRKINSKNVSIWSAVFSVTLILALTAGVYWIKASEKNIKGRKVAIVFQDISNEKEAMKPYQNLLDLQTKYEIPATWILTSGLIENLKQNENASDFFRQAKENRSDFIINVPNINYTIFINGDDEYIDLWKKRIQFVEENMANNGQKLTKYSINYKSQIPQEMENALIKKGMKETENSSLRDLFSSSQFRFIYEQDCTRTEKTLSCKVQSDEKRKEIRGKYIQYLSEKLELTEQYSQEKFGEPTPQILTFPADILTRDTAEDIVQMLKNKGYDFVSFDEVTSDEKFINLNIMSREHTILFKKQWDLQNKYLEKPFPSLTTKEEALKKAEENLKKTFNVEIITKDLKPKP
jgi:beta-lactamase regulating signal transducer with metallopeptidase domain